MGFLYSIILIKQRPARDGQKLTTPQRFPDYRWAAEHFIGFIYSPHGTHKDCPTLYLIKNTVWEMWSLDFTCEIIRKEASADDSLELKFIRVKHLRDPGLERHAETWYWFYIEQPADSVKVCHWVSSCRLSDWWLFRVSVSQSSGGHK